jgi:hypothetical protein
MQEKKSKTQNKADKRATALRDNLRKRKALQKDSRTKEMRNENNTANDSNTDDGND